MSDHYLDVGLCVVVHVQFAEVHICVQWSIYVRVPGMCVHVCVFLFCFFLTQGQQPKAIKMKPHLVSLCLNIVWQQNVSQKKHM